MKYDGGSKVLSNGYREAYKKITAIGYENIITGYPMSRAIADNGSSLVNAVAARMTPSNYGSFERMLANSYLLLPYFERSNTYTGGAFGNATTNIRNENNVWASIKTIKAKTLRCTACSSVFNKDDVSTPKCPLCHHPYNIKASKTFYEGEEHVNNIMIYADEVLDYEHCQCCVVSTYEVWKEYDFLRGYKIRSQDD